MLEGGFSSNLEYYTNSYRQGIGQARGSAAWFANTGQLESDLGGLKRATLGETTQNPARYNWQGSMSYVTGSHNLKVGAQYQTGTFTHTVDANGDLYQVYRSTATGVQWTVPDTVVIRNTPLALYGERLNYDYAAFVQDTFTMNRLSVTAGIRYEALNAQVEAAEAPAGRFVPARKFAAIENLPNWKDYAPRFAMVYDLFGNAKTALKYSINRYNQARTTGIAANYNPLLSQTASLTWRDTNGDNIATGGAVYDANGVRSLCTFGVGDCELSGTLAANFGTAAPNTYGEYPRTFNVEHGVEIQHELLPRLSLTGSWFHGAFSNLTTTINRSLQAPGDPLLNPNYTPLQVFNPLTGEAITVYSRTAAAGSLPISNLDTTDPNRQSAYNAYNLEFRARPGKGAQVFGGFAFERQLVTNCTAPDNPNSVRFCDETQLGILFNKQFKVAGNYPLPYGVQLSGSFQTTQGPNSTETMIITRGTTRYPSTCPAPCPAGEVILPSTFIGGVTTSTSLTVPLLPAAATFTGRITQLDLKVSRTFKVNRVSIAPAFEVFNLNNSDAIISYVSKNRLSSSYGFANSVMQPRMMGVGAQVKW